MLGSACLAFIPELSQVEDFECLKPCDVPRIVRIVVKGRVCLVPQGISAALLHGPLPTEAYGSYVTFFGLAPGSPLLPM